MLISDLAFDETYTFIGFKEDIKDTVLVEDNKHVDAHSNYFIKYYFGKRFTYDKELNENNTDNYYYFKTNLVNTDGTPKLDNNGKTEEITISLADPNKIYHGVSFNLIPIFEE